MNSTLTICEMEGALACKTLRTIRTKAFIPMGSVVAVNGFKLAELTKVTIAKDVEVEANYIPDDLAQSLILAAIIEEKPVKIRIAFSNRERSILEHDEAKVSGCVDLTPVHEVVKLKFRFPAAGMRMISIRPPLGRVKPTSPPNQGIGGKPGHLKFNGVYWECGLIPWCEHRNKFAAYLHRLLFPFWDTSECRH